MGIYISELLPNPSGKDTGNEWMEICNNGTQPQPLTGWKLQDASAKSFTIQNISVAPQSCVVFGNTETKISLNNDKETLSLFDVGGNSVDRVSYNTVVKDDQALARVSASGELQITTTPTKGEIQNIITAPEARTTKDIKSETENRAITTTSQNGLWNMGDGAQAQILTSGIPMWHVILIGVCVAGILAVLFTKAALELRGGKGEDKII